MKKNFIILFLFLVLGVSVNAQHLNVATYNLRFDNKEDVEDLWVNRCPNVAALVKLYGFDIFGTQEGLFNQLEDLKKLLPQYNYLGVARDDGARKGEHSAIFYNTQRFKLLDSGNFWLSAITDKPNLGWDAACIRICSWGKFLDNNSRLVFYMFNVHFDHKGEIARRESAKLMISKIKAIAGENPVIFTGDLNFDDTNDNYTILKNCGIFKDTYDLASFRYEPNSSFNNFGSNIKTHGRIDHIFVSSVFKVQKYAILTNSYMGRYPSDHFPVMTELEVVKLN